MRRRFSKGEAAAPDAGRSDMRKMPGQGAKLLTTAVVVSLGVAAAGAKAQQANGDPGGQLGAALVENAETAFEKAGFDPGKVDGTWNAQSEQALKGFQQKKGLEPTGKLTADAAAALGLGSMTEGEASAGSNGRAKIELSQEVVQKVQRALQQKGHDPGAADGTWGMRTEEALAAFQNAQGFEPTGELSPATAEALGIDLTSAGKPVKSGTPGLQLATQVGGDPGVEAKADPMPGKPKDSGPAKNAAGAVLETRMSADHGRYLVTGSGRTVYLFTQDERGPGEEKAKSACHQACATAWPPLIVDGPPAVAEGAKKELVATIERKDGKLQATYGGWPLYRFVGDKGSGEATGHGVKQFKGHWYLVSTDGDRARKDTVAKNPFKDLALKGPEAVRYDPERDRYVISNINGKMTKADNNGFISLVIQDGPAELKWIVGGKNGVTLHAPKGMQIFGGKLYVADIDHMRVFDAKTGAPLGATRIEGAKFLNDLAVASDGTVFITDTGTKDVPGAVYEIDPGGTVRAIAKGRDLNRPNGIDLDSKGNLKIATFAADEVLTMSRDGTILDRRKLDAGKLDGLVVQKDGSVLVSSWKGNHVVRLNPGGKAETILTGVKSPAAFDVDRAHERLLVPAVNQNRIVVAPLHPPQSPSTEQVGSGDDLGGTLSIVTPEGETVTKPLD